jgi:hypothetical protein
MKAPYLALIAAALACAGPAAADKKDKDGAPPPAAAHAPGQPKDTSFSRGEREKIDRYYRSHPEQRKQLPPGLAKKNKLPPGWQKKLAPGERIPDDVWKHRVELPKDIELPDEKGVIRVRIDDRVVKVAERTREVLDVFEIASQAARGIPPR